MPALPLEIRRQTACFAILTVAVTCWVAPLSAAPQVRVSRAGDAVEIDNGMVKARLAPDRGGVKQEYFAARGGEWVLLAEGFRPQVLDQIEFTDRAPGAIAPLYDTTVDAAHRFLATEASQAIGRVDEQDDFAAVTVVGKNGETLVEQTVEVRAGQPLVHIEARAVLAGSPPQIEYLFVPLIVAIDGKLDATHAPSYKPHDDAVISDRVFFSPVACVQKDGLFVGLVPDLDIINRHVVYAKGARQHPDSNSFPVPVDPAKVSMPTALDLVLPPAGVTRPLLSYGMIDSLVRQHVWFQHPGSPGAMVRELSNNEIRIGMDLLLSADAPKCRGYQMAAKHLWRRYGSAGFRRPKPQAMPYAEYAKVCYPAHFAYQGYDLAGERLSHRSLPGRTDLLSWQQWEADGREQGCLRLHAPQWYHLTANLGWWNNVCDATGMHGWSERLGQREPLAMDLSEKSRRMVNFALSAPQDRGMFPAIFDFKAKRWLRSLWNPPAVDYNPAAASAYWDWDNGRAYQTAAASVTAGYLLQYRRSCENDPRILPYVRAYGDFLLANLPPNGCVPGWFSADLKPLPSLTWNADGGAHAWVLGELYLATKQQKYLDGAVKVARFLQDEVLPQQRWADFEAFYSCAIKPETYFDVRTGQWPCNTMSVSWALQGLLAVHEATKDPQYLAAAEAVADFAALFQAVWAPEFIVTAYPFGGLSSQLGDAEWLDQRAHRFAEPFVRIGLLSGRQDLLERGIAAARSSLTLANHPRHQANNIYTHTDFPVGLGPENIDHDGFPQRPVSSGPSWNSIGGMVGVTQVLDQLGGAYVNFEKNLAVGVDGVVVQQARREERVIRIDLSNQLAALPSPWQDSFPLELRVTGLPDAGGFRLILNGAAPINISAAALASVLLNVRADGVEIISSP
jgi:hypothetical protein